SAAGHTRPGSVQLAVDGPSAEAFGSGASSPDSDSSPLHSPALWVASCLKLDLLSRQFRRDLGIAPLFLVLRRPAYQIDPLAREQVVAEDGPPPSRRDQIPPMHFDLVEFKFRVVVVSKGH